MRNLYLVGLALAASVACFACGDSDDDTGGSAGGSAGSSGGSSTGGTAGSSGGSSVGGSAGTAGASTGGSGGGGTGACTADSPAPGASKGSCSMSGVLCQDFTGSGWTNDSMSEACSMISGTLSTTACDQSAAMGSCQIACGGDQEMVQYFLTGGQGEEDCDAMKGKYTAK